MSPGLTFVMHRSICCLRFYLTWSRFHFKLVLCCLSFYVTWSHFRSVWFSMLSEFYVTWPHFRYVWFSMLSEFLCHLVPFPLYMGFVLSDFVCHLVSLPFCMFLYVGRVFMSLVLTFVMYGSLCCPSFYGTWSHFRYAWVSMLSKFLCHLVSFLFCMCPSIA